MRDPDHLTALIEKLREAGMDIMEENGVLHAAMSRKRPTAFDIKNPSVSRFPNGHAGTGHDTHVYRERGQRCHGNDF